MSFAVTNRHICPNYLTTITLLDGWVQTSTASAQRVKACFSIQTATIATSDERSSGTKRLFI
jgi:hypothetical protein